MRIGELAKAAGVAPSAIRYYERRGLIREPRRVSGIRQYSDAEADRLAIIMYYRSCGVSIKDLRSIFDSAKSRRRENARAAIARRITELDDVLQKARAMQRRLHALLTCDCRGSRQRCVVYRPSASIR